MTHIQEVQPVNGIPKRLQLALLWLNLLQYFGYFDYIKATKCVPEIVFTSNIPFNLNHVFTWVSLYLVTFRVIPRHCLLVSTYIYIRPIRAKIPRARVKTVLEYSQKWNRTSMGSRLLCACSRKKHSVVSVCKKQS